MSWKAPKLWPDSTVYILGSGISLNGLDLCLPPKNGRYGIDAYLHDKNVIGVNDTFLEWDFCSVWFWGDSITYWRLRKQIDACKKLKITTNRGVKWGSGHEPSNYKEHGVRVLKIPQSKGMTQDPTGIGWNRTSGAAAINPAIHFGAKRVVLVGYDMKDTELRKYKPELAPQRKHHAHAGMRQHLPLVARDAKKMGVEIINANPYSAITEFKKVKLTEVA